MLQQPPPRSVQQIAGSIGDAVEGTWVVEEAAGKKLPFVVARVLVQPKSTAIPLCVLNHTDEPVTVYSGMHLATMQGVESYTPEVNAVGSERRAKPVGAEKQEVVQNIVEQSGAHLSPGISFISYCWNMWMFWLAPLQTSAEQPSCATTLTLDRQLPFVSLCAVCRLIVMARSVSSWTRCWIGE